MRKLLFCSFIFENGGSSHLNTELVRILSKRFDITLLSNKEFLTDEISNINLIEHQSYAVRSGFSNIIGIFRNMWIAARTERKIKPDIVLISVYETKYFVFGRLFFKDKKSLAIVENNNIDHLDKWINKACYSLYSKKIKHFVFEEFIREYLINKYNIPSNMVYVLPHVLYKSENEDSNNAGIFQCVALSTSNDEQKISELMEAENEFGILINRNTRMFIKSKSIEFDDGFLVVKKGFIPADYYNELTNSCRLIYAPFRSDYKYRMSGWVIDGFSAHKRVVATSFMLAKEYAILYPELISVCDNAIETLNLICELSSSDALIDFSRYEYDHSEELIINTVSRAIHDEEHRSQSPLEL